MIKLQDILKEVKIEPPKRDPEEVYKHLRDRIKTASSVNSMLDIIAQGNKELRRYYKKICNKKFKGKIEPCRDFFVKEINNWEHNYWQAQIGDYDYYGD